MLSYQHGYHAGNRADCLKHAVLHAVLTQARTSKTPLLYVETHAGRGIYDLSGKQSRKTAEADSGVLALAKRDTVAAPLRPWLEHVKPLLPTAYPGSPQLANQLLSRKSRAVLFERHPTEFHALNEGLAEADDRFQLFHQDGYRGSLRLQPRSKEDMLVLLDPSYETIADMEALADWVPRALQKWPRAQFLIWLPLFVDERESDFGAFLSELDEGFVAGCRWPADSDRDSALIGSAVVGLRIGGESAEQAFAVAGALDAIWNTSA